ncbi:GRF1-interacting factor [Sarracenia purpurea var. burkii]
MQQPPQMIAMMPSHPATNITTEQIQKYLDENKKLILAILDNQNLGKLAECAQYQVLLQKNLMYLAAIADAQPQASTMPAQMVPHPAMQPAGFYTQRPQAAAMAQQSGIFPPQKGPLQFNNAQQLQEHLQQQQQQQQMHQHHQAGIQGQIGVRGGGTYNGMRPSHERGGGSKQDASEVGTAAIDGPGNSGAGSGGGGGE